MPIKAAAIKQCVKTFMFGSEAQPFRMRIGLLKGLTFTIDPRHQSQRLIGFWEREIAPAVHVFTKRARTAVDVGASDGWYTVFFASMPNIQRVFACEPAEDAYRLLVQNVALNSDCMTKVVIERTHIGGSGEPGRKPLDSLLRAAAEPILIKIDVDGAEYDVLRSGRATLIGQDVMLVVETHSPELEEACVSLCESVGYECAVVRNAWYRALLPELRPIPHNRWFLAEKRAGRLASET